MMRICTKRDAVCPHGMDCPYVDGYNCTEPSKPMTAPVPSDIDGPAGEALAILARCKQQVEPTRDVYCLTSTEAQTIASALAAYQAKVGELKAELGATVRKLNCDNAVQFWKAMGKRTDRAEAAEAKVAALTADIADKHSRAERYKKQRQWLQGRVEDLERAAEASEASAAALRTALEAARSVLSHYIPGSGQGRETLITIIENARAALPAKGEG